MAPADTAARIQRRAPVGRLQTNTASRTPVTDKGTSRAGRLEYPAESDMPNPGWGRFQAPAGPFADKAPDCGQGC
jgi:hypothetical protein